MVTKSVINNISTNANISTKTIQHSITLAVNTIRTAVAVDLPRKQVCFLSDMILSLALTLTLTLTLTLSDLPANLLAAIRMVWLRACLDGFGLQ